MYEMEESFLNGQRFRYGIARHPTAIGQWWCKKVICDMLLDRHRVALSLADSRPVYGYYMVCMKLVYVLHTCYMQIPISMHEKERIDRRWSNPINIFW